MSIKIEKEPIYNQIKDTSAAYENLTIRGLQESLTTNITTVGFTDTQPIIMFNSTTALQVVSTSTDDAAGGIGAQKIRVSGLYSDAGDNNKYKPRVAEFAMNGTTTVSSASSGTNLFSIINKVEMVDNGTGNCNQGDIKVFRTGTTNLMGFIKATYSHSHAFFFGVSDSKTLLIKDLHLSCFAQTACIIKIYTQNLITGARVLNTQILITDTTTHINHQLNLKINSNLVVFAHVSNLETIIGSNFITMNASTLLI
tara:strand:- start:228 stop:992 length:765 start_codon:yes stop_codon:yes gene_type:complete